MIKTKLVNILEASRSSDVSIAPLDALGRFKLAAKRNWLLADTLEDVRSAVVRFEKMRQDIWAKHATEEPALPRTQEHPAFPAVTAELDALLAVDVELRGEPIKISELIDGDLKISDLFNMKQVLGRFLLIADAVAPSAGETEKREEWQREEWHKAREARDA